jgi:DNA (cytosine-5)-methyltransferase 1
VAFDLRGREGGAMPEGPHDTANMRAGDGGSSRSYVAQPWAVRRLTPRECERLQGFPDDFTRIPVGRKLQGEAKEELARYFERTGQFMREDAPGVWSFDRSAFESAWPAMSADGPRYKALGNSWAVNVAEWVGTRIAEVDIWGGAA